MSRKIFIDCGANMGQSVDNFIEKWDDWKEYEIYSFEARPDLVKYFEKYKSNQNFNFCPKAVWTTDEGVKFYLSNSTNWGSSVMKEKTTGTMSSNPILVESIDLSFWIKNTFDKSDYIILKMDIEGAEYDVLNKMLDEDTFAHVNQLYIEFHASKVGKSIDDDNDILKRLQSYNTEIFDKTWKGLKFLV